MFISDRGLSLRGDDFSFATCQVLTYNTYTTVRNGRLSGAVARQTFLAIHHHTSLHENFSHWLLWSRR